MSYKDRKRISYKTPVKRTGINWQSSIFWLEKLFLLTCMTLGLSQLLTTNPLVIASLLVIFDRFINM